MKTLKKLHLRSVSQFLSDQEMRHVVGGDTYSNGYVVNGGSGTYNDPYQLPAVVITVPPKIAACLGLKEGERCEWADERGVSQYGYCKSYAPDYTKHCSDCVFC